METQSPLPFGGKTFDQTRDGPRLSLQFERVRELMRDGKWHTLAEISKVTGDPESSVSARLRDMRKPEFGGYVVDRRCRGGSGGTWEYSAPGMPQGAH